MKILIAGMAGASLGTEISKCLSYTSHYEIYGCDISPLAYGHYSENFKETFLVDKNNYIESVIDICLDKNIKHIIPGAESSNIILSEGTDKLSEAGLTVISNSPRIVELCSSKAKLFSFLDEKNILIPRCYSLAPDSGNINFPCIIKPSEESGGSNFVYLVKNYEELRLYSELLLRNNLIPVVQEYIDHSQGEYTVGVTHSRDRTLIGAIALKRIFSSKLSIAYKSGDHLISSGYTQGLIDDFPNVIQTCISIAEAFQSTGPLNIQGRIKDDQFIPFEINPRFSASTYLRTMAGFNEIDFYLRHVIKGETQFPYSLKYGYYIRSFEEKFIPKEDLLND